SDGFARPSGSVGCLGPSEEATQTGGRLTHERTPDTHGSAARGRAYIGVVRTRRRSDIEDGTRWKWSPGSSATLAVLEFRSQDNLCVGLLARFRPRQE